MNGCINCLRFVAVSCMLMCDDLLLFCPQMRICSHYVRMKSTRVDSFINCNCFLIQKRKSPDSINSPSYGHVVNLTYREFTHLAINIPKLSLPHPIVCTFCIAQLNNIFRQYQSKFTQQSEYQKASSIRQSPEIISPAADLKLITIYVKKISRINRMHIFLPSNQ